MQGGLGRGGRGSGEERASWGASSLGVKGRGPARRAAKEAAGKRQNPVRNPVWRPGDALGSPPAPPCKRRPRGAGRSGLRAVRSWRGSPHVSFRGSLAMELVQER